MGTLSGMTKKVSRERTDYYLEKTGLAGQRKKKMRQLSGGMKRRAGLVQALLNEPEFLIVDEPHLPAWIPKNGSVSGTCWWTFPKTGQYYSPPM